MQLHWKINISLGYPFGKTVGSVEVFCEWGQAIAAPVFERGQKRNQGNPRLHKLTLVRSVPSIRVLWGDISGDPEEKNMSKKHQY